MEIKIQKSSIALNEAEEDHTSDTLLIGSD